MPHVADVPATSMTEQAAGGLNSVTLMVLPLQRVYFHLKYRMKY